VWVNHHSLIALAARTDRTLLFYNLLLLMFVATIPFTTATLAGFIREGGNDTRLALVLYGVSHEGMALSFTVMFGHMLRHKLLKQPVSSRDGHIGLLRFGSAAVMYPVAIIVGLLSPVAMLVCYGFINGFYIFDQTPIVPLPPSHDAAKNGSMKSSPTGIDGDRGIPDL
jgi:uncharacterized membrane protein